MVNIKTKDARSPMTQFLQNNNPTRIDIRCDYSVDYIESTHIKMMAERRV
jgi:hypothetical protein